MRDYDPTTGRYLQADPLGLVDGASVYGYALQMPNVYTDPRGEMVILMCRPIVATGGWAPGRLDNHCAVFVVNSTCDCYQDSEEVVAQFSLPGGATQFDRIGKRSSVFFDDRDYYDSGEGKMWPIAIPKGMTACEFDMRVISRGPTHTQEEYDFWNGPNSNTAADDLIESAGGVAPDVGAQGQNYGEPQEYVPPSEAPAP